MSQTVSSRRPFLMAAGVAVLVLVLAGLGAVWLADTGGPGIGGPFSLVNGDGKPVTDRDFRGRYMLVYFGYTYCPDVCPTTLNQVADAIDRLGPNAARVQPVFITVDPQRDDPAAVKQFVAAFSPHLVGLTGSPEQIAQVAREYRVYYSVRRSGDAPGDYTVDHSSVLYLMDKQGRFVAPIRADESGAEMAADIAKHLS
jgi:protein SCO1/2